MATQTTDTPPARPDEEHDPTHDPNGPTRQRFWARPGTVRRLRLARAAGLWLSLAAVVLMPVLVTATGRALLGFGQVFALLVAGFAMLVTRTVRWATLGLVFAATLVWALTVSAALLLLVPEPRSAVVQVAAIALAQLVPPAVITLIAPQRARRFAVSDWVLLGLSAGLAFRATQELMRGVGMHAVPGPGFVAVTLVSGLLGLTIVGWRAAAGAGRGWAVVLRLILFLMVPACWWLTVSVPMGDALQHSTGPVTSPVWLGEGADATLPVRTAALVGTALATFLALLVDARHLLTADERRSDLTILPAPWPAARWARAWSDRIAPKPVHPADREFEDPEDLGDRPSTGAAAPTTPTVPVTSAEAPWPTNAALRSGSGNTGPLGTGSGGAGSASAGSDAAGSGGFGLGGTGSGGAGSAGTGADGLGPGGFGSSGTGSDGAGSAGTGSGGLGPGSFGSSGTGSGGTGSAGLGSVGTGASGAGDGSPATMPSGIPASSQNAPSGFPSSSDPTAPEARSAFPTDPPRTSSNRYSAFPADSSQAPSSARSAFPTGAGPTAPTASSAFPTNASPVSPGATGPAASNPCSTLPTKPASASSTASPAFPGDTSPAASTTESSPTSSASPAKAGRASSKNRSGSSPNASPDPSTDGETDRRRASFDTSFTGRVRAARAVGGWLVRRVWRTFAVALCALVAYAVRDKAVILAAHAGVSGESRLSRLVRGRAAMEMTRHARREAYAWHSDAAGPGRRWVWRVLAGLALGVAGGLVYLAVASGETGSRPVGPGDLAGLATWQQVAVGVGLAGLVALSTGSLGTAFDVSGTAAYLASYGYGAATFVRAPRAATRTYLRNVTPAGLVGDSAELALTSVPVTFGGAVEARGMRLTAEDYLRAFDLGAGPLTKAEVFTEYASGAVPIPGHHDVILQASGGFSPSALARLILRDAAYAGGPVRLLPGSAGGFEPETAQALADRLGVQVLAPSDTVHVFESGRVVVGPSPLVPSGQWTAFRPGADR